MKRDSSPPDAIRVSGPNGAPGLVETSNSTRSVPLGPASAGAMRGAEPGRVELQRCKLGRDRRIEARSRVVPELAQLLPQLQRRRRARRPARSQARQSARRRPRSSRAAARICAPSAASASASTRCLRASAADIEQPRFDLLEPRRIERQSVGRASDLVLGFARFDHRPVERRQRLGKQRMIGRAALDPPGGLPELCESAPSEPPSSSSSPVSNSPAFKPACIAARSSARLVSSPSSGARRFDLTAGVVEIFAVALGSRGFGARRQPARPRSA